MQTDSSLFQGFLLSDIVGVDEAGRGPLAGPVIAAAVILGTDCSLEGLRDSKKLSATRRQELNGEIRSQALDFSLGRAEVEEIDRLNILQASLLAMRRAVDGLQRTSRLILVDGNQLPEFSNPETRAMAVVKGDDRVSCISAASILAKVARDREMHSLATRYPEYGFDRHKGYGTREHIQALQRFGATPLHRRSFEPLRSRLAVEKEAGNPPRHH